MHKYCFYLDWSGWEPEVWAAWAQALLSAAAIFWAARIAKRQDRLALSRKAEACVGLITHAQDVLKAVEGDPMSRTSLTSVATLSKQMEVISLDAVPDYRLIIAVNTAANTVAVLNGELSVWSSNKINNLDLSAQSAKTDVRTAITRLQTAYEVAIPVANELASQTLKQRFNAWKLKRSVKK